MTEKPKRDLSRFGSVLTVVVPCAVAVGVVVLAFVWWRWMIPGAVETAMKRSILLYKSDIIERLTVEMNRVALGEIDRLNKAEEEYGKQARFEVIPGHPEFWGFMLKTKRAYTSSEIVDMGETGSLKFPYQVVVGYHFELLQTARHATLSTGATGQAVEKAQQDNTFHKTGMEGSVEMLYWFDADFRWDGRMSEIVRTVGESTVPLPGLDDPRRKVTVGGTMMRGWAPPGYRR